MGREARAQSCSVLNVRCEAAEGRTPAERAGAAHAADAAFERQALGRLTAQVHAGRQHPRAKVAGCERDAAGSATCLYRDRITCVQEDGRKRFSKVSERGKSAFAPSRQNVALSSSNAMCISRMWIEINPGSMGGGEWVLGSACCPHRRPQPPPAKPHFGRFQPLLACNSGPQ